MDNPSEEEQGICNEEGLAQFTQFQTPNAHLEHNKQQLEATQALAQALELSDNPIFQSIIKETLSSLLHNSPKNIKRDIQANVKTLVDQYEKALKQKLHALNKKQKNAVLKIDKNTNNSTRTYETLKENEIFEVKEAINFSMQPFSPNAVKEGEDSLQTDHINDKKPLFKHNIIPYSVQNRLRNVHKFKLYNAEAVLNFLIGLHPIAERYPNDFATILQGLADLHTGAAEATLSAAAAHPHITFEILRRSLLRYQITEKQLQILHAKYFLRNQTDAETLRNYINNKILIAKILGEDNETKLVEAIIEGIHPKFLALLGSKPVITTLSELWNQVTYLEMILANRAMGQNIPIAKNPDMDLELPNFSVQFTGESACANMPNTDRIFPRQVKYNRQPNYKEFRFNQNRNYNFNKNEFSYRENFRRNIPQNRGYKNFYHYKPNSYNNQNRYSPSEQRDYYNRNYSNQKNTGNYVKLSPVQFSKSPNYSYNSYNENRNKFNRQDNYHKHNNNKNNSQEYYNKNKYKLFTPRKEYGLMGVTPDYQESISYSGLPNFYNKKN